MNLRLPGCASAARRALLRTVACAGLAVGAPAVGGPPEAIAPEARYPEAPVWHDGALYFVEYSTGDVKRWDGVRVSTWWHRDACGPSGLIVLGDRWWVACYDENAIVELGADGSTRRVVSADAGGHGFTGPNDFTPDGHGGLYFSASGAYEASAPITGKVMRLLPDGERVVVAADTIHYPNGLTLDRDHDHLLVAEMLAGRVLSFAVGADGTLGARSVWARLADLAPVRPGADAYDGPDGLKLGPDGNVYIAHNGSGRVLVVGPDRRLVRTLDVPTRFVTNVNFGPSPAGAVFVTGVFDQWNAPFAGAVYRFTPEPASRGR